jgi:hypothetical protein
VQVIAGQQAAEAVQPPDKLQVHRQLFSPSIAAQPPVQVPQQQQQQPGPQQLQPLPVGSPSAGKKQSMLWSLMHRKGTSNSSSTSHSASIQGAAGDHGSADATAGRMPSTAALLSTEQGTAAVAIAASCGASHTDAAGAQQCLLAPVQHDRAPAVCAPAAVAAAAADATGLEPSSSAADVMAASMDRIASCLEDYLCDRSPSVSPTRDRPAQHASRTRAAAAGGPAAPCNCPGWLHGRDQGQGPSYSTAGDAVQHVTPKQLTAGVPGRRSPAGPLPGWSPAAAAAKARVMGALSPCKQPQQEVAGPVAGRDTGASTQHTHADQNGSREAAGAAVGWLHPGDLRPVAAVQHATARQQQPVLLQQTGQHGPGVAHLPLGLRAPAGLGLCTGQQQGQQHQELSSHAAPANAAAEAGAETAAAAAEGEQLASLFALACRAIGVDLVQADQQAAAPAVTAAALTAAMAAAATAYQQQGFLRGASQAIGSCQIPGTQARRGRQGQRTMLWRPEGCGAACRPELNVRSSSSRSQAWVQASFAQSAVPPGTACAAECNIGQQQPSLHRSRGHGLGQSGGGVALWRQQQQQQQLSPDVGHAAYIKTLQPERGETRLGGATQLILCSQIGGM